MSKQPFRLFPGRGPVALLAAVVLAGCGTPGTAERADGTGTAAPAAPAPTGATPGEPAPDDTTASAAPTGTTPGRGAPRTLIGGLKVPWGIAFLPGGDALVTERDSARVLRVTGTGKATTAGVVKDVSASGEGGLLGVAVSPHYAQDHYVFFYYTAAAENRVVRYQYDEAGLKDATTIVGGIPKGPIHNGGRLAFGPDGYLYASTGETGDRPLAQSLGTLGGKILRMTVDGQKAPGNPFGTLVWSYGHRNVQGMAWDDAGRMFATEFGQNTYDEINLIKKGADYGWPEVEGFGGKGRYTDPLLTWAPSEASPSGLAYANGALWVGALRGTRMWKIPVSGGRVGRPVARYTGTYGRLRAVVAAPDGSLWVSTSNTDGRGTPKRGDDRILVIPAT